MTASPVPSEITVDGQTVAVSASTRFTATSVDEIVALVLADLPGDTVLSDLSAARGQGLWVPERPQRVEVCVLGRSAAPRERPHSRRQQVRFRRRNLDPADIVVVGNVPMTSPARTWIDLAEQLDARDLVAAGDSVLRSGASLAELEEQVRRARGRRGVLRARQAIPHLDARSRSRPESCLRYELVSAGLPKPEVNVAVFVGGEWIGEPDLSYREQRMAIEYQGEEHAKVRRMRKDITRKLDFGDVDWLVIEAGPADVFRFPERIVHRVRFELDRRPPR